MKRVHSAIHFMLVGFAMACATLLAPSTSKAAKVGYSLPEMVNFNISLNTPMNSLADELGRGGVKRVVLDAGHGGKDPGCSGKHSHEKDVALDVTLRVGQLIKKHHPDVQVIYTRDRDKFVPLHERANIANKSQADLFISIHCNTTAKRNSAMGTETFVMGLHRAEDNLDVAKRENSVIIHEEDYESYYGGYDPNSDEGHITLSMYQNAFLDQSIALANMVENELEGHGQRVSRGVKQAGFLVLRNTVMPSILIEAGFLNHSKEETFLVSEEGKSKIAQSVFNAFTKYKYEQDHLFATSQKEEAIPADTDQIKEEVAVAEPKIKEEPINYVERAKRQIEKMKKRQERKDPKPMTASIKKHEEVKAQPAMHHTTTTSASVPKPVQTAGKTSMSEEKTTDGAIVPREKTLEYAVQISASTSKFLSGGGKWDKVQDVMIRREGNLYKYQVGMLKTYEEAAARKAHLRKMGFKDCFVVAYYNDDQIGLKEAQRLNL
ncbi:MAG: N-acetylmuramoyl-L-alanine amidase [Saprospiraceae bacterium]|nr:N-acetylmuramoyl-L-alanine amidase [Saprospiraceae bacterium]